MKLLTKKDRFMYFVILAFVFVSSTAMAASGKIEIQNPTPIERTSLSSKKFPPVPVLTESVAYPVLSAQGVLAVDLNSGVPLYEKNPDSPLLPASTTKIITALVALDTYKLDDILTVDGSARVDGQKMGLYSGEKLKMEDLLYGLLVFSANDAAQTLAANYPGGYDGFIVAMNEKASSLSMENSRFDNPVGLDGNSQHSTARDLVRASEVAMRNPEFAKIVATKEVSFKDVSGKTAYNLKNLNELLGKVPGVLGVKTGWTENARENLVTYVDRDGHKIMIAILGSQDRFGETRELINWIYQSYIWEEVNPIARSKSD
ncbi:MAG TPA: D-alanyl-D-alanine carboxypeptidase [Patescibacteria group bacterium]|nr:D-alanyl-D-alanine carboxypeptidase [Patescibacteria group bacterium]